MTLSRPWSPVLASTLCAACFGGGGTPSVEDCPPRDERPALLHVDCRGELRPGLARWQVQGTAVLLDLEHGDTEARELIGSWPAADQAPWLGHALVGATVLTPRRIRVEFRGPWPVPVRLFADPRLAPVEGRDSGGVEVDARDRIDRGDERVRTRHERSVDYGRALGRAVVREGFDRRYHVVLAQDPPPAEGQALEEALSEAWMRGGVTGSRRLPQGAPMVELGRCAPVGTGGGLPPREANGGQATVSFPVADPVAREIAERLVSASLPGGAAGWLAPGGLRVRGYDRGADPPVERSDLATVVPVAIGSVHPCSTWGELRRTEAWFEGDGREAGARVLAIGETAVFRIGEEGVGR